MHKILSVLLVFSIIFVAFPVWSGTSVSDPELAALFGGSDCTGSWHTIVCLPEYTQESERLSACCKIIQGVSGAKCARGSNYGHVFGACFHPGITSDYHNNDYDSCYGSGLDGMPFGGCGQYVWYKCVYSPTIGCDFSGNSCPSVFDSVPECSPPSTGFWENPNTNCDPVIN